MATAFDLCLFEENAADAQGAADAAFLTIDQLEEKLSCFIPHSDISHINALHAGQSTIVSGDTLACLTLAQEIFAATGGAFDPTVGCLLQNRTPWDAQEDLPRGTAPRPLDETVRLGFDLLALDPAARRVTALADGVRLDLGAIGKGFALDMAAEIMADFGISAALLSGGQSSMLPIGLPPGQNSWLMRLRDPRDEQTVLARVGLVGAALSTSSVGKTAHILDPASGQPITRTLGAWAIAPTAAASDALSTAFMVMSIDDIRRFCQDRPTIKAGLFTAAGEFISIGLPELS